MKLSVFHKAPMFVAASALLIVTLALLSLASPQNFTVTHPMLNNGSKGLVGTWIATANIGPVVPPPPFPANGVFEAVETFYSDGTMIVVSNLPGVTIGSGVWKQTGPQRYTFTFSFYRLDSSAPNPFEALMPGARVMENVLLIKGGEEYITTDNVMPLDGNLTSGQPVYPPGFPGIVTAKRYPFGDFNTVLP